MLFAYTKRVSGANRLTELRPHTDSSKGHFVYAVDPQTRYARLPPELPPLPRPKAEDLVQGGLLYSL